MINQSTKSTSSEQDSWCAFKKAQVRYRRRGDDPDRSDDLEEMIDFSRGDDDRILPLSIPAEVADDISIYRGPMYGIKDYPGILYWPQAISSALQLELAYRAISEYCEPPHATNIDLQPPKASEVVNRDDETMWALWKRDNDHENNQCIQDIDSSNKTETPPKKRNKTGQQSQIKHYKRFQKLSWSTMGYHYDWTARCYHQDLQSPMPPLLGDLACRFAQTALLHYSNVNGSGSTTSTSSTNLQFSPTASIVNFYNAKSIMGGHRDDLEFALDKPIVSISLGLPGVFLLGGQTKEDGPVLPILIRPGDVLCMGAESRLNFHGMARILPISIELPRIEAALCPKEGDQISNTFSSSSSSSSSSNEKKIPEHEERAVKDFLSKHRINMNVRQVYKDNT